MPTNKQREYVKVKVSDNISTDKALALKAGYSETTSRRVVQINRSKGVQELIAEANATEGLTDESVLKVISRAVNQKDYRKGATVAMNWLSLKYKTSTPTQDNRKVTINPDAEKLDKQAHIYISQKYNMTVPELRKRLKA